MPLVVKCEDNPSWKFAPPPPKLNVTVTEENGVTLKWNMPLSDEHAEIRKFELFAYAYRQNYTVSTSLWKKCCDIKAQKLPMSCVLSHVSYFHIFNSAFEIGISSLLINEPFFYSWRKM